MNVTVSKLPRGETSEEEVPEGASAHDLVRQLGLPSAAVLVLRSGRPIPIDEPLSEGDEMEVIYVASGG
jgi:sulfur carrier protein ThiS